VINLISIGVYTARFWPALRAELRPPETNTNPSEPKKPTGT
jgi:hypothetical protein